MLLKVSVGKSSKICKIFLVLLVDKGNFEFICIHEGVEYVGVEQIVEWNWDRYGIFVVDELGAVPR